MLMFSQIYYNMKQFDLKIFRVILITFWLFGNRRTLADNLAFLFYGDQGLTR